MSDMRPNFGRSISLGKSLKADRPRTRLAQSRHRELLHYTGKMNWRGTTRFGDGYVEFSGKAGDNSFHTHAAYQLVFATEGVAVELQAGALICEPHLYIRPNIAHRLLATDAATILLIEPHSPLGRHLEEELPPKEAGPYGASKDAIDHLTRRLSPSVLDERLQAVMKALSGPDALQLSIADLAGGENLSSARLRELANEQIGMTPGKWRTWTALGRACQLMAEGVTAASAAYEAGFSDQAHLIRTMRKTLGITPAMTRGALRAP